MRDVIAIRHCVGAQQVHFSLRFGRWWRTRFFPTLLSTFSRWASTASSASTPAFTRFSHFTRLVSCRLWKSKTPHASCYNTTAKSKQSCWKAIEMRYTILALRACLKIVHTHHFEGKKTPALEPVKGGTLIPNLSRTLSTLKLPHDRLIVLLMIACPFRRNANKSGRQCMGWLHSVTIPTIFKWATGSRRLFFTSNKALTNAIYL